MFTVADILCTVHCSKGCRLSSFSGDIWCWLPASRTPGRGGSTHPPGRQ